MLQAITSHVLVTVPIRYTHQYMHEYTLID